MAWFKVDDQLHSHPKARRAGLEAMGLWLVAGSHCMSYLTDGFVEEWFVLSWPNGAELAERLVGTGLWLRGDGGWQFHDWAEFQPTKVRVEAERSANARRQELSRDPKLRDAIRDRDGSTCRYCGETVRWNDRKGSLGGTYDHVDPKAPNSIENLVVACRGCNSAKGSRTPEQAGMILLKPRCDLDSNLDSDSNRNLAPSPSPSPSPRLLLTESVSLGSNRAREDETDSEAQAAAERLASAMGLDLEKIRAAAARIDRGLDHGQALRLATIIIAKARREPTNATAYVMGAFKQSPLEVQQTIDTEVMV